MSAYEIIDIRQEETGQSVVIEWSDGQFLYSQLFSHDVTPERIDQVTKLLGDRREHTGGKCHELRNHYRLD